MKKMKSSLEHGGQYSVGKRKTARPLVARKPTHLVIKTTRAKCFGISLIQARDKVEKTLRLQADRLGVRIYSLAVQYNHCHMAIYFENRKQYVKFIRAAMGHLVLVLSKLFKKSLTGLFDLSPFTRVGEWGRPFSQLINYIQINELEAVGLGGITKKREFDSRQIGN